MNYRMINNHVAEELSLSETNTYLELAKKSDYKTHKSVIKQSTLSDLVGLCENQLREHLNKMKDRGLILKERDEFYINGHGGKKCRYELIYDINLYYNMPVHWVYVDIGLLDKEPISKELKAFLVKAKICCYNYTNYFEYSAREMAPLVNLGHSSVSKYISQAIKLGYIKKEKVGKKTRYTLTRNDIFIIPRETDIAVWKGVYPEAMDEDDFDERGHYKNPPTINDTSRNPPANPRWG